MLLEAVLLVALGISWNAWLMYLKHAERMATLTNNRQDAILRQLGLLSDGLQDSTERIDASIEKQRALSKGFLDSMTDIVKLSEADKQALQNRIVASKLEKR